MQRNHGEFLGIFLGRKASNLAADVCCGFCFFNLTKQETFQYEKRIVSSGVDSGRRKGGTEDLTPRHAQFAHGFPIGSARYEKVMNETKTNSFLGQEN